uniref:large ribosomal subunit protein P2 n=1 Tax=Myxine glutinosa TaxID=7769 RepID=UPI00358E24C0
MRYVAAYLLAALGGNSSPTAVDIRKILDSVGIETEDDKLTKIIKELKGKNVNDVISAGFGKLASMPAGGAVVAPSSTGQAAVVAEKAPAEEKVEKEESEESDDDMGFGLFD